MSALSSFGIQMIEGRILAEIRKFLDEKVSGAFLASVLPPPAQGPDRLEIAAEIHFRIEELAVDYTAHVGGDEPRTVVIPPEDRMIVVRTSLHAKKDASIEATAIPFAVDSMTLAMRIDGIEFKKMMLGVGATVHNVRTRLSLNGTGSAQWHV